MNDIDKMPVKCRDCAYWELARKPYVCTDCESWMERLSDLYKPMPNDDYIKRSDAVFAVQKRIEQIGMGNIPYVCSIRQAVRDVPAADVEPVRHGRWIDENPESPLDPRMRCSVCGHVDLPLAK